MQTTRNVWNSHIHSIDLLWLYKASTCNMDNPDRKEIPSINFCICTLTVGTFWNWGSRNFKLFSLFLNIRETLMLKVFECTELHFWINFFLDQHPGKLKKNFLAAKQAHHPDWLMDSLTVSYFQICYYLQNSDEKISFTKCSSFLPRSSKLIFQTGNGIIQTGNGII